MIFWKDCLQIVKQGFLLRSSKVRLPHIGTTCRSACIIACMTIKQEHLEYQNNVWQT